MSDEPELTKREIAGIIGAFMFLGVTHATSPPLNADRRGADSAAIELTA
jgi:hypothetical protein